MERPFSQKEDSPIFQPPNWQLKDVRATIPPHLFVKSTTRGLLYLGRDLLMIGTFLYLAIRLDDFSYQEKVTIPAMLVNLIHCALWLAYWWFQGLAFTGLWVLGHECGHGGLTNSKYFNDMIGFILHTALWTPYFSWKISHHRHHCNHASMDRDEVFVPNTRADLGIPDETQQCVSYDDLLEDTPLYSLFCIVGCQVLGFPAYIVFNVSGQKRYPRWTNHLNPNCLLFSREQRSAVILSDAGLIAMAVLFTSLSLNYGFGAIIKLYLIPWFAVTHWVGLATYLQHTDPVVPRYRQGAWNFTRGATATIDRDFLGWQGRFFLHGVSHHHVVHHFFPKLPFYNAQAATDHLKKFMGEYYMYSDKPVFRALWDTFRTCLFVDNQGDVVFFRDRKGRAARRVINQQKAI